MRVLSFVLVLVAVAVIQTNCKSNPIEKALQMITHLQTMLVSQASDAQQTYSRYAKYCEERSGSISSEVKTEKASVSALKAAIYSNTAALGSLSSKIDDLSADISSGEQNIKAAMATREQEAASFKSEQTGLQDMIESLKRAISSFSKKDQASLLQDGVFTSGSGWSYPDSDKITQALGALVDASAMSAQDAMKLSALVQEQKTAKQGDSEDADDDEDAAMDSLTPKLPNDQAVTPEPPPRPPGGLRPEIPEGIEPPQPTSAPMPPSSDFSVGMSPPPMSDSLRGSERAALAAAGSTDSLAQQWLHALQGPPLPQGDANALPPAGVPPLPSPSSLIASAFQESGEAGDDDPTFTLPLLSPPTFLQIQPGAGDGASAGADSPLTFGADADVGTSTFADADTDAGAVAGAGVDPLAHVLAPVPAFAPAPAPAVYTRQHESIVMVLESLLDKAAGQLEALRGAEGTSVHNFKMLKSSLADGVEASKKDMAETKSELSEHKQAKSVATGDLEVSAADLAGDLASKATLHHECLTAAEEFQAAVANRGAQLTSLAKAKKAIVTTSGHASAQTYSNLAQESETSFVQQGSRTEHSAYQATRFVRKLATQLASKSLAQLAARMSSSMKFESVADPFGKTKKLIENMISKLEEDEDSDATLKSYCDEQMASTVEKLDDSQFESDRLNTAVEQKMARAAKLRQDVATLQGELAGLAKAQVEASTIRQHEKKSFQKYRAEMEQGLAGIQLALKILKEHYGQDAASNLLTQGPAGGIIGLLDIVEEDFTKSITEQLVAEEAAASYYESTVQPDSKAEAVAKEREMKFKMKEFSSVSKAGAEISNDAAHVSQKLRAVQQYDAQLRSKCGKPDSIKDRGRRRDKEVAGLKEALATLTGATTFLQLDSGRRLRGAQRHTTETVGWA